MYRDVHYSALVTLSFCKIDHPKFFKFSAICISRLLMDLSDSGDQVYHLTNWLMFLCGQIQSPRPNVMPDRREGIVRAEGFVAARIETSVS